MKAVLISFYLLCFFVERYNNHRNKIEMFYVILKYSILAWFQQKLVVEQSEKEAR